MGRRIYQVRESGLVELQRAGYGSGFLKDCGFTTILVSVDMMGDIFWDQYTEDMLRQRFSAIRGQMGELELWLSTKTTYPLRNAPGPKTKGDDRRTFPDWKDDSKWTAYLQNIDSLVRVGKDYYLSGLLVDTEYYGGTGEGTAQTPGRAWPPGGVKVTERAKAWVKIASHYNPYLIVGQHSKVSQSRGFPAFVEWSQTIGEEAVGRSLLLWADEWWNSRYSRHDEAGESFRTTLKHSTIPGVYMRADNFPYHLEWDGKIQNAYNAEWSLGIWIFPESGNEFFTRYPEEGKLLADIMRRL